jgi:hypothetical protein
MLAIVAQSGEQRFGVSRKENSAERLAKPG